MNKGFYVAFVCIGAAAGLGVLYVLPGSHNITDAKIAAPVGALAGYALAWLLEKWLRKSPRDPSSKESHTSTP